MNTHWTIKALTFWDIEEIEERFPDLDVSRCGVLDHSGDSPVVAVVETHHSERWPICEACIERLYPDDAMAKEGQG